MLQTLTDRPLTGRVAPLDEFVSRCGDLAHADLAGIILNLEESGTSTGLVRVAKRRATANTLL